LYSLINNANHPFHNKRSSNNDQEIAMKARLLACLIFIVVIDISGVNAAQLPAAGIATAHPLATEAGHEILDAGGNAFDAAVAISASLAVVEPMSSGLGGGGFWLLHRDSDGFETMIDGREKAPLAAQRDMYLDELGEVRPGASINGPLSAGIPGEPAAIVHIAKTYGRLSLARDLKPAIRQARQGFKVDHRYQRMAKFRLKSLRASPAASAVFLRNNEVPELGTVITQPDLARTLERIAQQGSAAFYQGEMAERLVDGVKKAGGIWRLQDLADYRVIERQPIRGEYHGMKITSAAPPSSGGITLITMLNILSGYKLDQYSPVQQKHLIIEAMRRAYRDRAVYLGDPDFVKIPTQQLLSPYYAAGLRAGIRDDQATPSDSLPGVEVGKKAQDTTHFSVIDKEGNRVAATLTINYPFGSCFMPPGTGVLLNDEMDDFSAKPGSPNVYGLVGAEANAIAPGKRPLSSMTPSFLVNDRGVAVLGTPGGSRIITMVLLATLNYFSGGTPETMVSLPRFHHQYLPDEVQYEEGALSEQDIAALTAMGHELKQIGRAYGNMQAVVWDRQQNKVMAASDPRHNGRAEVK
jgi:gamma-glutamyltranspeptidase/glutathione hydrolase